MFRRTLPLLLLTACADASGDDPIAPGTEGTGGKADGVADAGEPSPPPDIAGSWQATFVSTVTSRPVDEPEAEPTLATTHLEATVEITQDGYDLALTLHPSAVAMPSIEGRQPEVDAALFAQLLPATFDGRIDADGWVDTGEAVVVLGAALEDAAGDALPVDDDDERLVDLDADDEPGVTIRLGSFEIYAAVRLVIALQGATTGDEVAGSATLTLDFEVLGDDIPFVNARARIEDAAADTEVLDSSATFRLARAAE